MDDKCNGSAVVTEHQYVLVTYRTHLSPKTHKHTNVVDNNPKELELGFALVTSL